MSGNFGGLRSESAKTANSRREAPRKAVARTKRSKQRPDPKVDFRSGVRNFGEQSKRGLARMETLKVGGLGVLVRKVVKM